MKRIIDSAARAAFIIFGAVFVQYVPGILEAPDVNVALALATAGAVAGIVAVLGAAKGAFPKHFSWALILKDRVSAAFVARLDIATFGAVGVLIVSLTDFLNAAPDLETWPAALTALVTASIAAGVRTFIGATTKGETPFKDTGVVPAAP